MRDYSSELFKRIEYVKAVLKDAKATGIVFGNSGGKDCALAGIICKLACDNTVALIMPCGSKVNLTTDKDDALKLCEQFEIAHRVLDLTDIKKSFVGALDKVTSLNKAADININPRLRMMSLYAVAAAENRLVAGTGNRSERYMGYFTKWGDGAFDFNPIADLTVREIYEFLKYLDAPKSIITKAPSAGLFEGQTDEFELGISYNAVDEFLLNGTAAEKDRKIIDSYHGKTEHKRIMPSVYKG